MDTQHLQATLVSLFELTRAGCPHAGALARELGTSPARIARSLLRLEQRGLVDAGRVRLTMRGLAVAAALSAERPCAGVSLDSPAQHGERPARPELSMDESPSALATSSP